MDKLQIIVDRMDSLMEEYIKEIEHLQIETNAHEKLRAVLAVKINGSITWLKAIVKPLQED